MTAKSQKWAALIAFVLVILLTGVFTVRTVRRAAFWRQHRDEVIRPWMTIPYVAHSYRVPPRVLYQALGVAPQPHDRRPLKQIAHEQNRSVDEVISLVQDAINRERANHPNGAAPPNPREVAVSISEQLLALLSQYGLPVLFGVIAIAAVGIPLPISMMLVAAGSFVEMGEMKLWQVIVVASAGAVLGDQMGYALGRWSGHRVVGWIKRRRKKTDQIAKADDFARRWGGAGIFFSRWLVTPLGPWLNLTSGMTRYPWPRFLVWDVVGEVLWVVLYVMIGKFFSDRVQELVEILGNLAWVVVGLIAAVILGWKLVKYLRPTVSEPPAIAGS